MHSQGKDTAVNGRKLAPQCGKRGLVRRAYALMLVLVFVVLFLAMLGVAWRQMASVLRIEAVRSNQIRRDQGCLLAAIQGIHYLEQNASPESPQVFTVGGRSFTVTFEQDLENTDTWTVNAVPTP
jgi:hypothetical protein